MDLTTYLLKLPALRDDPDVPQLKLLARVRTQLKQAKIINEVVDLLDETCASLLDYDIFQSIADEYSIDENQTDRNKEKLNYPEHLKAYIEKHKLSEFIKINPELTKLTNDSEEIICLKFDIDPAKYRLADLVELKSVIADILEIQASTLRLLHIEEGCVAITFLIPSPVAHYIFPQDKKFNTHQVKRFLTISTLWLKCCNLLFDFRELSLQERDDEHHDYSFLQHHRYVIWELIVLLVLILDARLAIVRGECIAW